MKYKKKIVELTEEIDNEGFWKLIFDIAIKLKARWGI